MSDAFDFKLNGQLIRVEKISPNTTLLEFLRATGRTGTKEGCAEGDCGACSVAIVEHDANGKNAFRAINSCLIPICLLAGREVISVEGIGGGKNLHPVQQKMVECHGSQCGYCTPGFITSLFEAYYRDDLRTEDQLNDQLCGNLCRCTGYRPIRDAALEAFAEKSSSNGEDPSAKKLQAAATELTCVQFESPGEKFFRPKSLRELFQLRDENPNARLIAGATELGLDITKRFKKFPALISVEGISDLRKIDKTDSEWRIGAAATLTEIEDLVAPEFSALAKMLRLFGSRQIRNRATMGGNLVTASPIGDSAPVLLAMDARVILASDKVERVLPIADFFVSYRKTALQPGEILKTILFPRSSAFRASRSAFYKVSKRVEMDISTVAACFAVELDERNLVRLARLAFGGVAATPVCAKKTEAALLGKLWYEKTITEVLPILEGEFSPISDVRGSAAYRKKLITSLLEKFYFESGSAPASGAADRALAVGTIWREGAPKGSRDGSASPHESAHLHVTGEAIYTDDFAAPKNSLEVWPVCAPHARAKILKRDAAAAKGMPGIAAVLLAEDVPGLNDVGAVRHDEILLADKEVFFHGQIIALVVGESQEACRTAAEKIVVEYEPLSPVLKIADAIAQNSFHNEPNFIRRGDIARILESSGTGVPPVRIETHRRDACAATNAPQILEGEFSLEGQEHFYLEMNAAWAEAGENGSMFVMSSTQHPTEVQHCVAHVLGVHANKVVVQCPRMGGGFGGKETQAATFAALAALASAKTNRPVRVRVNRDLDMMLTGKRHPFLAKFKVGFTDDGELRAAKIELFSNGGWSLDLSQPVTDRAVFHLDNCYYIPNVEFSGRIAKTNLASNTAFRGFGGPQGMLVIEEILDRIARRLNLPPEVVREKNLYRGTDETNTTHYGQEIEDNRIQRVWHELKANSEFEKRRSEMAGWNSAHPHCKRGLAMTPVKFGISFTMTHLNQAGALVLIYQDGTVQVNHGGTEMGQGVHTNVATIAARELGLPVEKIRIMPTSTDKVPNTSATAASCGTDLNGAAVKNACEILRGRLAGVAAGILPAVKPGFQPGGTGMGEEKSQNKSEVTSNSNTSPGGKMPPPAAGRMPAAASEDLVFANDLVYHRAFPDVKIPFVELVKKAYVERISLSATGYYRTPEIHYDRAKGKGKPFHYFAVGAAVTEVEVDRFTGMTRVLRTDILHDAGDSINPGINRGQIEGGFVQGMGWLTCEQLIWDEKGKLLTHSPDTYKIPAIGDMPEIFNVSFLANATQRNSIYGSKAVGEPPLMLAISVREAIRDAVAAFGNGGEVQLASPATCEAIFMAIQKVKSSSRATPLSQSPLPVSG